jgi:hypothetical protein
MNKDQLILEQLVEEIIMEGSHGDTAAVKNLIKKGERMGLIRSEPTDKGWMIKSLVNNMQIAIHRGETGLHELRRFLQKLQKI